DRPVRQVVQSDRHVAQHEDIVVQAAVGDGEAVAGGGLPRQAGVAQPERELEGDHASSVVIRRTIETCVLSSSMSSVPRPRSARYPIRYRRRTVRWSGSWPPACAAATGTAGKGTTR